MEIKFIKFKCDLMTFQQAQRYFLTTSTTQWVEPSKVTSAMIKEADKKLVGVPGMDGDALSDIKLNYTTKVKSSCGLVTKKYEMPIAVYLVTGGGDISTEIKDLLIERIGRTPADNIYKRFCLLYSIQAYQHLNGKNMAHYIMEDAKLSEHPISNNLKKGRNGEAPTQGCHAQANSTHCKV